MSDLMWSQVENHCFIKTLYDVAFGSPKKLECLTCVDVLLLENSQKHFRATIDEEIK